MADTPLCPRCKRNMKLMRETDNWWEMACEPCQMAHVMTKPRSKNYAKVEVGKQRKDEMIKRQRALGARPKYFLPIGGK